MCRLNEMLNDALTMEAKHKAERDALRAQVAKMEAQTKEDGAAVVRCLLVNERLRAQVEAVQALCASIDRSGGVAL